MQEVVVESDSDAQGGRLAFRTAEQLDELSGKGTLADETELSGPCFADDGQTLYFSRSRPGQRADILRTTFADEGWSKPEQVRELNSVDDDRRLTLTIDGRVAALASNRSGGHGGFDIYEATQSDDRWPRPHNAGAAINTDAEEFDPALSPDGLRLYFVRVVPGASADLFVARRDNLDSAWTAPEPVAAINSPDHHERSPAVSPDGKWLLFASNRGARPGESAPFGLFRAPLLDGQVGTPERVRDGLASDADDLDAAFAPDGQSLVFVSKREGTKQIYLSRGEFVVTRLTVSTAHLDQFGPVKWCLPILATVLLIAAWKWSRRPVPVAVVQAEKVSTAVTPPKRSEPPKNPLQSWTVTSADQVPPPTPVVNPLKVPKVAEPAAAGQPTSVTTEVSPPRRRRWAALAIVTTAAAMLVVMRIERSDQTTENASTAIGEWSLEFLQFSDIAPLRTADFPKLERTSTARTATPEPTAPPSNTVALRPGARWPTDRVVVRKPSELSRTGEVDQRLLSLTKAPAVARRPSPAALTRPTERPGEDVKLAVAAITAEKPNGVAPTVTTKQSFDPNSTERTAVSPAVANQATLRGPSARLDPLIPSSPTTINDSRRYEFVRSGAVTRKTPALGLTEPEALIPTNTASTTTESPLPARAISVSRVESVPLAQPTPLNSKLPLDRRALPMTSQDPSNATIADATRPASRTDDSRLPSKSSATPKVVSLTEEVVAPTPAVPSAETNVVSPSATLSRGETQGPQPSLPSAANGPITTQNQVPALRLPSRVEASDPAMLTAKAAPALFARRETLAPTTATISAVDSAGGMGTAAPAILLTSASMLVELLTSAPMPALPRAESGSPTTSVAPQLPGKALPWFVQAWAWTLPTTTEPNSLPAKPSLPRRVRETVPAELVEPIPTTP